MDIIFTLHHIKTLTFEFMNLSCVSHTKKKHQYSALGICLLAVLALPLYCMLFKYYNYSIIYSMYVFISFERYIL